MESLKQITKENSDNEKIINDILDKFIKQGQTKLVEFILGTRGGGGDRYNDIEWNDTNYHSDSDDDEEDDKYLLDTGDWYLIDIWYNDDGWYNDDDFEFFRKYRLPTYSFKGEKWVLITNKSQLWKKIIVENNN